LPRPRADLTGDIMKNVLALCIVAAVFIAPVNAAIIKTGDVLEIQVLSHPEFSGEYTVNENGMIDYPMLADVAVANVSTAELMNDLTLRLARHVDNPLVLISVVERPEIAVTVLGQVMKPGLVKIFQGSTLQEAVVMAGGPTVDADLARVRIFHRDRGESSETYNLKQFLSDGNIDNMPQIKAGDVIVVLSIGQTRKIKVIGAVQKPGLFTLEDTMNIFEVIYMAGGPAEKADLSRVRRMSSQGGKSIEEVYDIQGYIDKGEMNKVPKVQEGDIIIVYSRWFDWKELLTILNNVLLIIVTIETLNQVFK
jgi:protein involved in polysaccharide export with SLBB domain